MRRPSSKVSANEMRRESVARFPSTIYWTVLGTVLASSLLMANNTYAQQASTPTPQLQPAGTQKRTQILIPLSLTSSVDAKKLKEGAEVDVKTAVSLDLQDGRVIPQGAKVIGHVTEAKARSKGDTQSSLGIVFDKIELAKGGALSISGVIRALGPNPNPELDNRGVDYGSSLNRTLEHAGGGTVYSNTVPVLNQQSQGVVGIKHLELGDDGVIKSDEKTVKLESGWQIMLKAQVTAN